MKKSEEKKEKINGKSGLPYNTSNKNLKLKANLINFLIYFAIETSILFIPLLAVELGASNFLVGVNGAAYGVAFLISSLIFGRKSDTRGRVIYIQLGLGIGSVAYLTQLLAFNLAILIVVRAFVGFALGISTAALVAYIYESQGNMGKFSSNGSLGWIAGALTCAILKEYHYLFLISAALSLFAFVISLGLKEAPGTKKHIPPNLWRVTQKNFRVYLAVFLRHLGAASVWVILPLFMASLGADKTWIAILWSINFGVQFITMRYVDRFPASTIFMWGQVLSVLVFLGYGFSAYFFHGFTQLIIVQAILGFSWSFLYVGALLMVLKKGEEKGTASGIFNATLNLCNAVGPFLGGAITQVWSFQGAMFFAAGTGLIGLLTNLWPQMAVQEEKGPQKAPSFSGSKARP
jgi:MFS family permease